MPRQGIGLVRACKAAQSPAQIEWYRGKRSIMVTRLKIISWGGCFCTRKRLLLVRKYLGAGVFAHEKNGCLFEKSWGGCFCTRKKRLLVRKYLGAGVFAHEKGCCLFENILERVFLHTCGWIKRREICANGCFCTSEKRIIDLFGRFLS